MKNRYFFIILLFFYNICFSQEINKKYVENYYTKTVEYNKNQVDGKIVIEFENTIYALNDFLMGNPINAKYFGVKADGVSDDTKFLQLAINYCTQNGLTLFLPTGRIITTSEIDIKLNKNASTKFRLVGNGISNSVIINKGENTKIAINVMGNYYDMFSMKDFSIERVDNGKPTGGVGIKLNKLVYADFENIDVFRFNIGLILNDISSSSFRKVNARWGTIGAILTMEPNGMSNPNLIDFNSCIFNSNQEWGIKINNAHNVNFNSCLFEDNTKGGINLSYNNSNGAVSVNVRDSYFEGNSGYDIYLKSYGQGSHNFYGNTFNRVSNKKFTENNIYIEIDSSIPNVFENSINMEGNGFFSANTYQPSDKRKNVKIVSNNRKTNITDNNSYRNPIEK